MQVHGTPHVHGPHGITAPHFASRNPATQRPGTTQAVDRVEISSAADAAIRATETSEIRQSLVNSIRSQIAAGTYDTPEKFDAALNRMLDEIV